ncbi:hypothetical protein EGCR1_10255 [Enterococcus gilvus]|jgi:hypothetical protein|uniref:hypothetical protein n=1 Tax=Enterococcus gilvus TaxID=160453 RepID=UPI000DF62E64|nr:hypothetical protein [Enterococcus gilvus]AXG39074.1 hypothetical protein EGCR1_10255 [Enterococcus gilvus]
MNNIYRFFLFIDRPFASNILDAVTYEFDVVVFLWLFDVIEKRQTMIKMSHVFIEDLANNQ